MLHLLLAEAALELVPSALWGHPAVAQSARRQSKKPREILLDDTFHHTAMRDLPEHERRGRPDIAHVCLLYALDSPLNLRGRLRVTLHTRSDEAIAVDPATRIQRSYNRFVGLMEQLLALGRVPPTGKPLLEVTRDVPVVALVDRFRSEHPDGRVLVMDAGGERADLVEEFASAPDHLVVVGAFPTGDFQTFDPRAVADRVVSIHDSPLSALPVVGEAVTLYMRTNLAR